MNERRGQNQCQIMLYPSRSLNLVIWRKTSNSYNYFLLYNSEFEHDMEDDDPVLLLFLVLPKSESVDWVGAGGRGSKDGEGSVVFVVVIVFVVNVPRNVVFVIVVVILVRKNNYFSCFLLLFLFQLCCSRAFGSDGGCLSCFRWDWG